MDSSILAAVMFDATGEYLGQDRRVAVLLGTSPLQKLNRVKDRNNDAVGNIPKLTVPIKKYRG